MDPFVAVYSLSFNLTPFKNTSTYPTVYGVVKVSCPVDAVLVKLVLIV